MTDHYYSRKPISASDPRTWEWKLRGRNYTFTTDVGVFSKREIDYGTQLLIESFETPAIDGDLLDLGCGYGPVGVSIADHYPEREVILIDINERAIHLAQHNLSQNNIQNANVLHSDGFSSIKKHKFAAILTNPPIRAGKKVVHQLFEDSQNALLEEGELWVVIQKKQGAPSAKRKLEELFHTVVTVKRDKGYYIFCAQKS